MIYIYRRICRQCPQVKRSTLQPPISMQSTLFCALTVFVRSVARSRTFVSRRTYTGSTGGCFSTLHALTFVTVSSGLFAYSSRKRNEKMEAAKKILEQLDPSLKEDTERLQNITAEVDKYLKNKEQGSKPTPEKCIINDAIHGPIELSPLLFQIINTPEFHRLKDVRQLGAAHYVYPGANHTRFDHSIGYCHLAGEFAKLLKEHIDKDRSNGNIPSVKNGQDYQFKREEVLCAKIAGLCHDLGHGPYSHMFEHKVVPAVMNREHTEQTKEPTKEDVIQEKTKKKVKKHETLSVDIFKRMLVNNPKVLAEFVHEALTADHVTLIGEMIQPPDVDERTDPQRMFLYEIVANKVTGIDVDKWDYYARDCHYLGLQHDFQWRRCMLLGRVVLTPKGYKGESRLRIGFRDKELDNIYGMFRIRGILHQKAYQHKTVKAVEKMIADAIVEVQDLSMIRINDESETIKKAIELTCTTKLDDLKWYLSMSDSIVTTIECATGPTETARGLLQRVRERDLYSCSATIRIPQLEQCQQTCNGCKDKANLGVVKTLYKSNPDKDKFAKNVCDNFKASEKTSKLEPEEIWVEVVEIRLASEKDSGTDSYGDPLKQVVFYKKGKGNDKELPETSAFGEVVNKASKLVVPQAFLEYELRVYDKRKADNREENAREILKDATQQTLADWREKQQTQSASGDSHAVI